MLSSQDISQYHSNSPIYATHKSTSVLYEKYRHSQQCQKIDTFIRGFFSDSHCSVNRKQYVGVIFDTPNTVYPHYSLAVLPSVHVVFFYTRVSDYTRRLMIANLLYSIPKVLNSYHFAYRSSRLCLHVCLVKRIINLSITSKYLLKKLASGTYLLASFSVQRGGGGRACFSHLHMHLITAEFHSLRILLIYFHTLITPNIDTKW